MTAMINTEPNCIECKKFYSTPEYDNKCSYCFKGILAPLCFKDKEFQEKLNKYVESKTIDKRFNTLIKKASSTDSIEILKHLHITIKEQDKGITAKFAEQALRPYRQINAKSHIICSLIIDWWNMRNFKFNSTEMCYYGRFGDHYDIEDIKTIPPPPPNPCIFGEL